jgi:DNA-damage-inducible protein J
LKYNAASVLLKGVKMVARKQTSIKVDPVAWESAKEVFKEYNLTLSDAINIFLNKVRLEQGMPFDIRVPSKQLKTAMEESKNNQGSFYDSVDEMMDDLKQ